MTETKHTPTQPLAIKAQLQNPAMCVDCGFFFNWIFQTKHDGCPECNSKRWQGTDDIRRAVNSHEALLEAAKHFMEKYEAAMHDEYDFPNSLWSYERDKDEESLKHIKSIAQAEGEKK